MDDSPNEESGERIIDLAEQAVYVSVKDRLLVLEPKDGEPVRVELREIAAVLAAHYGVTFTRGALSELAKAGAIVVICDQRSMPVSMFLPLDSFHAPARRMAAQAAASRPLNKRLWKSIVQAKILAQAKLLYRRGLKHTDLVKLASGCKSGDPTNVEAQASRVYWQRLFGENFRRISDGSTESTDENRYLNYGYAVLRALVCRALCGAGLHPGLGIHHHHRNNPFPLADDLMEPFRPLVDELAIQVCRNQGPNGPMDRAVKEQLLSLIRARVETEKEVRGLGDALGRLAGRLGIVYEGMATAIQLPVLWPEVRFRPSIEQTSGDEDSIKSPPEKSLEASHFNAGEPSDPLLPKENG